MINTLLIDIEGTLVERGRAVPGAPHALAELTRCGLGVRLLTNISSRSAEVLAAELGELGFEGIQPAHIHTAASAAQRFLVEERASFSDLLLPDGVAHLFRGLPLNRTAPDYVVVGDVGERFTYENLSAAFRLLRSGSRLLALQRNLYWDAADGAMLDAGAFVAALEAASGRAALLSGKPSAAFFRQVKRAAVASGVSERTAYRWLGRYRRGDHKLLDRSSAPRHHPARLAQDQVGRIEALRRQRMTSPAIARQLGIALSTVGLVLRRLGLNRLARLEPRPPVIRYERERPGEMIHLDIKKLGKINGIGHRFARRGPGMHANKGHGWDFLHVAVDDASRLAYTEILPSEGQHDTTAFLDRALGWFGRLIR